MGARYYLVKPVRPDQFEQTITACFEETSGIYAVLPDGNLTRAQQLVGSAVSYILQHYMRLLKLEDLAQQVHVSPAYFSYIREALPGVLESFMGFAQNVSQQTLISPKTKELMAVAVAVGIRCQPCITNHVRRALDLAPRRQRSWRPAAWQ